MAKNSGTKPTLIIKKVSNDAHDEAHGGAWKVAYADFVTAMMAFFIMLWILAVVEEEQLKGIAEYFQPTLTPQDFITGEGVLSGTTMGLEGVFNSSNAPMLTVATPDVGKDEPGQQEAVADPSIQEIVDPTGHTTTAIGVVEVERPQIDLHLAEARAAEESQFDRVAETIVQAMREIPDLEPLVPNVIFEKTPQGLRIQIVDQEKHPMFPLGGAEMFDHTRDLMALVGVAISSMPNDVVITGHTDSRPFANDHVSGYGNWELSSDRANATRRVLLTTGIEEDRIIEVSGVADRDPILPEDPDNPINRRISIVLAYSTADPVIGAQDAEPVPAIPSLRRDTMGPMRQE